MCSEIEVRKVKELKSGDLKKKAESIQFEIGMRRGEHELENSDLQKTKIFQSQIRLLIGKLRSWKIAISEKKVGTQKIGVQIGEYESWKIAIYKKRNEQSFSLNSIANRSLLEQNVSEFHGKCFAPSDI